MQPAVKIQNKTTNWNALLRPRVLDVVRSGSVYYQNVTGYNGAVTDLNIWIPISSSDGGQIKYEINKESADIAGSDPFFHIDLSAEGLPQFLIDMAVYIDQTNSGSWVKKDPVDYDPITQILSGMDNPADFPAEKIKIIAI